jgi:uncharacterized protein
MDGRWGPKSGSYLNRTKGVSTMTVDETGDFGALEPFFRVIEEGLAGLVDGGHFFDLLADDVVFEFIITVANYPRRVVGRDNLVELYRGYQSSFFLDRCFDLRTHRSDDSTVTLEYASEGTAVATGRPYSNRYISVVTIKDRKIVQWRDYLDPLRVLAALERVEMRAPVRLDVRRHEYSEPCCRIGRCLPDGRAGQGRAKPAAKQRRDGP